MGHLDRAIAKYAGLVAPWGVEVIRHDAQLILDGTPCNKSRGWYGTKPKPGCHRDKEKSAAKKKAKSKPQAKGTTKKVKTISAKNVVSIDKKFDSKALNKALGSIASNGAATRVGILADIIDKQGIQSVFNTGDPTATNALLRKIENKGVGYDEAIADYEKAKGYSETVAKIHAEHIAKYNEAIVGDNPNTLGYTMKEIRHVVVQPHQSGAIDFNINKDDLARATNSVFDSFSAGNPTFSVSGGDGGTTEVLLTYLHEIGHQVKWIANLPDAKAPKLESGLTTYSRTNRDEQFAEHFALWMLDADKLKSTHPQMHKHIEKSIKLAQKAPRRLT